PIGDEADHGYVGGVGPHCHTNGVIEVGDRRIGRRAHHEHVQRLGIATALVHEVGAADGLRRDRLACQVERVQDEPHAVRRRAGHGRRAAMGLAAVGTYVVANEKLWNGTEVKLVPSAWTLAAVASGSAGFFGWSGLSPQAAASSAVATATYGSRER